MEKGRHTEVEDEVERAEKRQWNTVTMTRTDRSDSRWASSSASPFAVSSRCCSDTFRCTLLSEHHQPITITTRGVLRDPSLTRRCPASAPPLPVPLSDRPLSSLSTPFPFSTLSPCLCSGSPSCSHRPPLSVEQNSVMLRLLLRCCRTDSLALVSVVASGCPIARGHWRWMALLWPHHSRSCVCTSVC